MMRVVDPETYHRMLVHRLAEADGRDEEEVEEELRYAVRAQGSIPPPRTEDEALAAERLLGAPPD